jgi:hypothetical protein
MRRPVLVRDRQRRHPTLAHPTGTPTARCEATKGDLALRPGALHARHLPLLVSFTASPCNTNDTGGEFALEPRSCHVGNDALVIRFYELLTNKTVDRFRNIELFRSDCRLRARCDVVLALKPLLVGNPSRSFSESE